MRGKKAKQLRRRAEVLTPGRSLVEYIEGRLNFVQVPDGFNKVTRTIAYTGTRKMIDSCTRYLYRGLKRVA